MLRGVLFFLLCAAALAQEATFRSGTQLVVETVAVTDKKGNPVTGLTAKDFAVSENGVPQEIKFFDQETLPQNAAAATAEPEHIHVYDKLGLEHIRPARYTNKRLLALYFDMTSMPPGDQLRALSAAEKYVRTRMTAADVIAILRYAGGAVNVLQDFTANRNRLLSILQTMMVGEGQGMDESMSDADSADNGAAFGQDDSEFNIFNTDRQLSALQTAANMLGQLNEKKALIYFASGLRLNGLNNQAQLHATVNSAIRAGVTFWPIDARGLVAEAPLGDATQGSPGNQGMYSGAAADAAMLNLKSSQDSLYALASDTGGKALLDYNDLTKGVTQAADSIASYYVLGYYTSNTEPDGKFRRIKISVDTSEAKLDYRQGYFASKVFAKFTAADKERQLEDALMLPDPITELTIAMEVDYFQLNRAEYFVPVVVKIPGRELALAKRRGAEHTLIDFVGEIKDDYGSTMTNLRDKVDVKLTDKTAAELAKVPVEYDAGFTLLPGKYSIKFLARDAETGRIGTYQTEFRVPNLNRVVKEVPISSVVLSSQRVELKDALYNAVKGKERSETANPLVENGSKLIPSVTRVFSKRRELYVFLEAYEQASARPLVAYVGLYAKGKMVFESPLLQVKSESGGTVTAVPLEFDVGLRGMAAGEYECQVTVLDPVGEKAAFWQAPIVVVP